MPTFQAFFDKTIDCPEICESLKRKSPDRCDVTPPPKKRGRKPLPSAEKQDNALYRSASKVLEQHSPKSVFRAATLAARRARLKDAAYVFQKLENDTEGQASLLRQAETQSSQPSKTFTVLKKTI